MSARPNRAMRRAGSLNAARSSATIVATWIVRAAERADADCDCHGERERRSLFRCVSLALTFFAKEYIIGLAQDFVADRTQRLAEPSVEIADQALRAPGIGRFFDDEAIETARQEIDDYRRDPRGYIAHLVAGARHPAPDVAPVREASLRERVTRWKGRIRQHFEDTLDRLVWDLRIFSGSNLAAALIAAWCALWAAGRQVNWLLGVAFLMLTSVAYGAYMYVDGVSYFRILFNTYIGWWYPVVLAMTFLGLYLEYGRQSKSSPS
jgi:hypothetical protein